MKVPTPPKGELEYDFRQSPTRISAQRFGASWIVYEKNPLNGKKRILAFRPEWEDAYTQGKLLCRALDGRTIEQGVIDKIIEVGDMQEL